jgi:hypothetical protein
VPQRYAQEHGLMFWRHMEQEYGLGLKKLAYIPPHLQRLLSEKDPNAEGRAGAGS